jgi:hypothetical protein
MSEFSKLKHSLDEGVKFILKGVDRNTTKVSECLNFLLENISLNLSKEIEKLLLNNIQGGLKYLMLFGKLGSFDTINMLSRYCGRN